jgi:molybdate transport system substrate-binding protein
MKTYRALVYRAAHRPGLNRVFALVLFCGFFISHRSALGQTVLHIAAASDLQPVLPTLAAAYEAKTGVHSVASFGSSATLAQQLANGDPQDIFLAADFTHPEQLIASGLATGLHGAKTPTPYASGVLVLWARKDSPAQPLTLDSLTSPKVNRIAIANPLHAPYGLAAQQALQALHMATATQDKLVVAENISQTAQFAESGNAQLGLISLTTASTTHFRETGSFVRIPTHAYAPIRQTGVILNASKLQAAAEAFLTWLTGPETQSKLPAFGLDPAN